MLTVLTMLTMIYLFENTRQSKEGYQLIGQLRNRTTAVCASWSPSPSSER